MKRSIAVAITLMALTGLGWLAGCGVGEDDVAAIGRWITTVDTLPNGAVHVEHIPPADPEATWSLEPELNIGRVEGGGPEVFGEIGDLAVARDGRIVVLDWQAQEIRIFAPGGDHLRTFGGKGGGPGEFEGANGVVFGPDGLLRVGDTRNDRLSLLDPDSGYVSSHPYSPMFVGRVWLPVIDSAGHSWSQHYLPAEGLDDEGRVVWIELALDGTPGDTIRQPSAPQFQTREGVWVASMGDDSLLIGVINYPHAEFVLDPERRLWSTPQGDPAYRLIRWRADGDMALVLDVRRAPVPTDMARADSQISEWERRFGIDLDRSRVPETAPAILGFFFDDDGRLWVCPRRPTGDSTFLLDAFDADTGEYQGTLATDLRLQITPPPIIHGSTLWGVVWDELEVPRVVRAGIVDHGVLP